MTDNEKNSATKMTDNEIILALEICQQCEYGECLTCPYNDIFGCNSELMKDTLDLIKRQKEQIESLIAGQETLQKALNEKIAEVEALNGNLYTVSSACKQRRNEAVKEFAERLKETIEDYQYVIDNLVKEMVGEK